MEKILAMRDASTAPSFEDLEKLAKQSFLKLRNVDHNKDVRSTEMGDKIKALETEKAELQKKLSEEKSKLSTLAAELASRNENLKLLEEEKIKLTTECRMKETERNRISDKCKTPSAADELTLENGRKKLEYYKNLTCVRWDYPVMKTCVKGYVTNKQDYIHPFTYDVNDKKVEEKLWEEIGKCFPTRDED